MKRYCYMYNIVCNLIPISCSKITTHTTTKLSLLYLCKINILPISKLYPFRNGKSFFTQQLVLSLQAKPFVWLVTHLITISSAKESCKQISEHI